MTIEENKRLVTQFFACFSANDIAAALDRMTDDVTWWISGKPEHLPAAGDHTKEQIAGLFYRMSDQLVNGLKMPVKGLIAEGDKVAVEVVSIGELQNGRIYNNEYHMLMTIRDGKISEVKEYLDTQHVFATWFQS
jgi:ketosteroid isomerase-like protein